jgi:hypothetical protein
MNILEYCNANPRDYTYIGIGSKNRYSDLEKFTPEVDQILPCFLSTLKNSTRVIHFDPYFAPQHDNGFLEVYFKAKGFHNMGDYTWMSSDFRTEVMIIPQMFDDAKFLYKMIQQAINYDTQLVVQRYTGQELAPFFKEIYLKFSERDQNYIKKNVLFDITYGADCSCMTNMKEHAPMTDKNGYFYNFILYNEQEILDSIGVLPKMDRLIESYFKSKLAKSLKSHQVL